MELLQGTFPASFSLAVLVGEGSPLRRHQGKSEGSCGLRLAVGQNHVSVDVTRLGELPGAVGALVGSGLAHRIMLFDVLLQLGQCREAVGADRARVRFLVVSKRLDLLEFTWKDGLFRFGLRTFFYVLLNIATYL